MTRWALVTAATSGLGEAFTRHLAGAGFSVIAHHHRSHPRAEALAAELPGVHAVAADLAARAGRETLMGAVAAHTGALHLIVHNLGVYPLQHLLETDIDVWENTFALTCTAAFHLTQLGLPLLRAAAPDASLIFVGDAGADRIEAHDDATPYHIAKLGVHVLARTYAARLAPEGIRANLISPGFLVNSVGEPNPPLPMGRKGAFDDVLAALDFLISERARYVSGANLTVSGAWNV